MSQPFLNVVLFAAVTLLVCRVGQSNEFELLTSDGKRSQVSLVQIATGSVHVDSPQGRTSYPLERVMGLQNLRYPTAAMEALPQPIQVQLIGGSRITARQYVVDQDVATLELAEDVLVQIDKRNIQYVKFAEYKNDQLTKQWDSILAAGDRTGDVLVFQRNQQLDYLDGVVGTITSDTIAFSNDTRQVEARRERIDGVVYYHAAGRTLVEPVGRLITTWQSELLIKTLDLADDSFLIETVSGARLTLPQSFVREIDLASTRFAYVSQLVPSTMEWKPLILNKNLIEFQKTLNRPRFDQSFQGTPLALEFSANDTDKLEPERTEFPFGIAVKGGSRIVYKLEGQYKRLLGNVGFSPLASEEGDVEIIILGDNKELWRQTLRKRTDLPQQIDLSIANVARLALVVDYHDARNIGDVIHFCDLKVTK